MSADHSEARERARQEFEKAESWLMDKLGVSWMRQNSGLTVQMYEPAFKVESLMPCDPSYRAHVALGDAWKRLVEMEVERRSLEQERDELRERLDDLVACWDVFYSYLPDGDYQGIGQMRVAASRHRAAPPVHKGDS